MLDFLEVVIHGAQRVVALGVLNFVFYFLVFGFNLFHVILFGDHVQGPRPSLVQESERAHVLGDPLRRHPFSVLFDYLANARVEVHVFRYQLFLLFLFLDDAGELVAYLARVEQTCFFW